MTETRLFSFSCDLSSVIEEMVQHVRPFAAHSGANVMSSLDANLCYNRLLRDKREAHHWTIEEVSSRVNVDARTYRRWEHGEQRPHLHSLKHLCALFGCSTEDLGYSIDSLASTTMNSARRRLQNVLD